MLAAVGWGLLGLSSAGTVLAGVGRNRPGRTGPWLLLGAALVSMTVGDVCFALGAAAVAEAAYLAMFPLVGLSLLQLTRDGAVLADRARTIDLLALACAVALVTWVFVINSTQTVGSTLPADVLGGLVLTATAGRLVVASRGNPAAVLIGVGAAGLLASDVAYPLAPGHLTEAGYLLLYLAWPAAAMHPSMTALTAVTPARPCRWERRWAVLLVVSVATPPTVLLIQAVSGTVTDGLAIAAASGITLVLTITRLTDSLDQHSRALDRERGVREAGAAMVAAADVCAVDEAVRAAVRHLLPPGTPHKLVFAPDDEPSGAAAPPPDAAPGARSWWLEPDTVQAGSEQPAVLVCALRCEPAAPARTGGGALVLSGRRAALAVTRDALEVLAGQAALAVDRIALVEAVGRRDSDQYLRAVISNTAEVMIVTDRDQRIRYASPAVATLVGAEPAPLSTVYDLVHPGDRQLLRSTLVGANGGGLVTGVGDVEGPVYCALQRADGSHVVVELSYRDLREDRLVQGFVITIGDLSATSGSDEQRSQRDVVENLPARVNRRSASGKFRY